MTYTNTIKIPKKEIEAQNALLVMEYKKVLCKSLDNPRIAVVLSHTVKFPNGYEADIKLCAGEGHFYVDPVLFDKDGCQMCVLDACRGQIDGEYEFEANGDTYKAIVEAA